MGLGRWLLLGDIGQQMDLADHEEEIRRLRMEVRSARGVPPSTSKAIELLRLENEELKLYLAAVIRLLVAKNVASADEIKRIVAAVDAADGKQDGKVSGAMMP